MVICKVLLIFLKSLLLKEKCPQKPRSSKRKTSHLQVSLGKETWFPIGLSKLPCLSQVSVCFSPVLCRNHGKSLHFPLPVDPATFSPRLLTDDLIHFAALGNHKIKILSTYCQKDCKLFSPRTSFFSLSFPLQWESSSSLILGKFLCLGFQCYPS